MAQIGPAAPPAEATSVARVELVPVTDVAGPRAARWQPEAPPIVELQKRVQLSTPARLGIGIVLVAGLVAVLFYLQRPSALQKGSDPAVATAPTIAKPEPPPAVLAAPAAAVSSPLPFPLPSNYGVYAVSTIGLSELQLLPEPVPDKRVAMSTPINRPSLTTLPDGKARFVVFRRDLAGNAPDRVDVRVVARVTRALSFDAKGKASFSAVSDTWNIRNIAFEFRVRPIAGNPEMLLIQQERADFALPAGRYVLALKNQGYDFTVAGNVTDPSQCLERTEAANGAFYSDCKRP
jgi:hypothetical protein